MCTCGLCVQAGVAGLPGDHVQASATSRQRGNQASLNSHQCWVTKDNCIDPDHDCCDHHMLRRGAQTDLVVEQIKEELADRPSISKANSERITQCYGINPGPSIMKGVDVDTNTQSMWDLSHLLWFGLIKLVVKFFVNSLSKANQEIFMIRLRDFKWPKNTSPPIQAIKSKFGSGNSMTHWRTIGFASPYCLQVCVDL